jgi:hypothetical protein
MTATYITHMMKERSKGIETAKCGVQVKQTKSTPPMTVWWQNVDCEGCKAAMGLQEPPVKKRLIPRQ